MFPIEDVGCGEIAVYVANYFVHPPVEDFGRPLEYEGIFVTVTES